MLFGDEGLANLGVGFGTSAVVFTVKVVVKAGGCLENTVGTGWT